MAENAWQAFMLTAVIGGAPLFSSFVLTANPWTKNDMLEGWAAKYSRDIDDPTSKRSHFRMPLWAFLICHMFASAGLIIGGYILIHNGGLNNGMDVFTFPLMMMFASVFFTNAWGPLYLHKHTECYNYSFLQVLSIITAVATLIFFLENMDTVYGIWSALWLTWTVVLAGKTFVEDRYAECPGNERLSSGTCSLLANA